MTRSRWSTAAVAACILAVLVSGAIAAGAETPPCGVPLPDVVAKVGDHAISRADLLLRLNLGGAGIPSRSGCVAVLEKAVRAAALRPELAGYRIEVSASEVEDAVEKVRASFPSDGAFRRFLIDRDADLSLLRRAIEDGLLLKKIEERQIRSWVFGDDLIEEYFDQHRGELVKDRVRVRHILLKTQEDAERALAEARGEPHRSFRDLVSLYSVDTETRERDGDLGWVRRGTRGDAFDRAAFSAPIGAISSPVKTSLGYELLLVEVRQPAAEQTLEDHRDEVVRRMQEEEWAVQREEWWDELKQKAQLWIAPELNQQAQTSEEQHAEHEF
jgi:parvulin-like peptidyl-prolyl isomerase